MHRTPTAAERRAWMPDNSVHDMDGMVASRRGAQRIARRKVAAEHERQRSSCRRPTRGSPEPPPGTAHMRSEQSSMKEPLSTTNTRTTDAAPQPQSGSNLAARFQVAIDCLNQTVLVSLG